MSDAKFWNRIARKYAKRPIGDREAWEATLTRARAYLEPMDHVLELGCGTGGTARKLAPHVAHVTATDIASEMIAIARQRQDAEGLDNITHLTATANDPVDGAPFDAVVAFNLLHLVPHLDETLAHIHALVRPGGAVITKTPCVGELSVIVRLVIPIMQAFGKAPDVLIFTRGMLETAFRDAGFEIEETGHFGKNRNNHFVVARRVRQGKSGA